MCGSSPNERRRGGPPARPPAAAPWDAAQPLGELLELFAGIAVLRHGDHRYVRHGLLMCAAPRRGLNCASMLADVLHLAVDVL